MSTIILCCKSYITILTKFVWEYDTSTKYLSLIIYCEFKFNLIFLYFYKKKKNIFLNDNQNSISWLLLKTNYSKSIHLKVNYSLAAKIQKNPLALQVFVLKYSSKVDICIVFLHVYLKKTLHIIFNGVLTHHPIKKETKSLKCILELLNSHVAHNM